MPRLDHVNIHVADGPRMVEFLESVLDAREGVRPPFGNAGHWVYVDGVPAIHLDVVQRSDDFPRGMVNHVAFGIYDFDAAKARIEATGCTYKITGIPGTDIGQFFVTGPEGLVVEVQFRRQLAA